MRPLLLAALALLPLPALADTTLSAEIAATGLRATEARLAALPAPTPDESFALGGVRFLGGVERALQLRYRVGLSDGLAVMSGLPLLRLPLPDNPAPDPFAPDMIAALFDGVAADMEGAVAALAAIPDDAEVGVEIATQDLWFDIDGDGARTPGEGMMEVAGFVLSGGFDAPGLPQATIRFDTADARWLSAYAHLLAGASEAILATDPTEAIARVTEGRAAFAALGEPSFEGFALDAQFGDWADLAAMVVMAVEGPLDPARTRAARDHWLAVAADNRAFWTLVAREADNDREWIPNKRQESVTGLPFPPDTGALWLSVLAEAEAVLRGERLIPFWRVGEGAGVDLGALLEDPPVVDLAGAIQGATLLPYLRPGPTASARSLWAFMGMLGGDAPLYMVMLN